MKTFLVMTMTAAFALTSGFASADSKVYDSKIKVYSENQESYSEAYGKKSLASVGSVNLRDTRVYKSDIDVNSNNKYSEALANGDYSTSTVGSVTAE